MKIIAEPAWWCAPFLSSNDHIDFFDEIVAHLKSFPTNELELVSVIGGMKFLEILERLEFARVTLFDKNINELYKWIRVWQYLQNTQYQDFDHFVGINKMVKDFCTETILDPVEFPHFQWRPKQDGYERVRKANFNPNLYLSLPNIDLQGRLAVVFLSHCPIKDLPYHNALPIYARPRTHDGKGFFIKKRVNRELSEPHSYWLAGVNKYRIGTTCHVWPPEMRDMAGGLHDQHFTRGIGCFNFLKLTKTFDTVITHIFLGKSKHTREDRFQLLQMVLNKAKFAKRIIVTDYNKDSGQFDGLDVLPPPQEIIDRIKSFGFKISEVFYTAAGKRELLIII